MKYSRVLALLFSCVCVLTSCATTKSDSSLDLITNSFVLSQQAAEQMSFGVSVSLNDGNTIVPQTTGTVMRCSFDAHNSTNLGKFVELELELFYFWKGQTRSVKMYSVYANLETVNPDLYPGYVFKDLQKAIPIGTIGKGSSSYFKTNDLVFAIYATEPDILLDYITASGGYADMGVYWYSPIRILNKQVPRIMVLGYEDVNFKEHDFLTDRLGSMRRFEYKMMSYPEPISQSIMPLYMFAMVNNFIPDYDTLKYSYAITEVREDQSIVMLFPQKLMEIYKERRYLGTSIYIYAHIAAQSSSTVLLVVDESMDAAPELLWRDPKTKNLLKKAL